MSCNNVIYFTCLWSVVQLAQIETLHDVAAYSTKNTFTIAMLRFLGTKILLPHFGGASLGPFSLLSVWSWSFDSSLKSSAVWFTCCNSKYVVSLSSFYPLYRIFQLAFVSVCSIPLCISHGPLLVTPSLLFSFVVCLSSSQV